VPSRIIKESILTSPTMAQLSPAGERHFYRCLLRSDDWGCFECTPGVLAGVCYPLVRGGTPKKVGRWNDELETAGIIKRWQENGRQFAVLTSFDNHNRYGVDKNGKQTKHRRKTPEPPKGLIDNGL
jgi:hypothetical protein